MKLNDDVYSLNTVVFKHKGITWEWGMVAASCLVYIAFTEIWKFGKRVLRRRAARKREAAAAAEDK